MDTIPVFVIDRVGGKTEVSVANSIISAIFSTAKNPPDPGTENLWAVVRALGKEVKDIKQQLRDASPFYPEPKQNGSEL